MKSFNKKINVLSVLVLLSILLMVSEAFAASWWYGSVFKVENYPNGTIKFQMDPSATQVPTPLERSRLVISPGKAGSNQMMATILTAVSLGLEISVYTDFEPDNLHQEEVLGLVVVNN